MFSRSARFSAAFSKSVSALRIQLVRLTNSYPGRTINVSRPFSAMRANSIGSLGPVADHSDPPLIFKGLPVRPAGSHTNDPQPNTAILMTPTVCCSDAARGVDPDLSEAYPVVCLANLGSDPVSPGDSSPSRVPIPLSLRPWAQQPRFRRLCRRPSLGACLSCPFPL